MARFQLRRLETSDSGRSLDVDTNKASNRRGSTYITPVDSELSQRRMMDDLMNSTRPRSEGEQVGSTIGREKDTLRSSQSHVDSRPEESPRRPGAPSFHSNNAIVTPPATASVMPAGTLGTVSGALGGRYGRSRQLSTMDRQTRIQVVYRSRRRRLTMARDQQQGETREEFLHWIITIFRSLLREWGADHAQFHVSRSECEP